MVGQRNRNDFLCGCRVILWGAPTSASPTRSFFLSLSLFPPAHFHISSSGPPRRPTRLGESPAPPSTSRLPLPHAPSSSLCPALPRGSPLARSHVPGSGNPGDSVHRPTANSASFSLFSVRDSTPDLQSPRSGSRAPGSRGPVPRPRGSGQS
jgi:hypothetical protein